MIKSFLAGEIHQQVYSRLCQFTGLKLSLASNLPGRVQIVNFSVTFLKTLTHMASAVKN